MKTHSRERCWKRPASVVSGRVAGKRDCRGLENEAIVVRGVRARQRIPPDWERFIAERMEATTGSIAGPHSAFVAQPVAVAEFRR